MIEPPGWEEDRLDAAFEALVGTTGRAPAVAQVMERVRTTRRLARWLPFVPRLGPSVPLRPAIAIAIVAVLVATLAVGKFVPRIGSGSDGLTHHDFGEFSLDYPADWAIHDKLPASSGFGSTIAILGTQTWGDCTASDSNCFYQRKLDAGAMSVEIGTAAAPGVPIFAPDRTEPGSTRVTVGGLPAIFYDRGHIADNYYLADLDLAWAIATPASPDRTIEIRASFREPGVAKARSQVEAMVGSLTFDGPLATIPTDAGQAGAAAGATRWVITELDSMLRGSADILTGASTIYGCFLSEYSVTGYALVS